MKVECLYFKIQISNIPNREVMMTQIDKMRLRTGVNRNVVRWLLYSCKNDITVYTSESNPDNKIDI